ncbi:M20 family metallopeptidase [Pimelobacter simplex]|uniref:Probable succinyl-diaminopimelate desuccinylase n=1 Tax=Nocardioides simplex TaxID=2045 RepID=A0A7J5E326_NOCSI|nr:ArgE/DapE family deacylase [Pimelobacter simplex]KAB2812666.1 M20 family metallopeptidase [Pimelobacter simplex]
MSTAAADAAAAAVSRDRVVALTEALVRCDTQNPPGRESSVVPALVGVLEGLGCAVEVVEPVVGRPSVLATYRPAGAGDAGTLLVNGHLDVVPVVADDWTHPPFAPTLVGTRLHGRGTADMKGGIAAALEGLAACRDAGVEPRATIAFHLVADEETGGAHGTEALVAAGRVHADACIIPEPTELGISVAERGSVQVRVRVEGEAGHGSEPGAARSAIADAARMITALHDGAVSAAAHPYVGTPTCNVALVEGGVARNVVAPWCTFVLDRRTAPGETLDDVLAGLRRVIDAACPGAVYALETLVVVEASEVAADHPFPRFVAGLTGAGDPGELIGLSLGTDGRFLRNQLAIPTVIYGPGSIRQAHTADEWVEVGELVAAARTFARAYASFTAGGVTPSSASSAR